MANAVDKVKPFDDKTLELCDRISTEVMRPLVTQKEFLYVDADVLFDYRLGALLATIKGEDDYNYILKHVDEYLNAPSLECAKSFPDLNRTDADLDKLAVDKSSALSLAALTPPTKVLEQLPIMIRVLNTINLSKETQRPIHVTVNQRRVEITDFVKNAITAAVTRGDASATVAFTTYKSWFDVPEDLLKRQDVIIVYDLKEFLMTGTTSQKLLVDTNELSMTDIMALTQSELKQEDTALGLDNMKNVMELMCDKFTFINKTLLVR